MTQTGQTSYRLLPAWTIQQAEKSLVISGGADARYEVELTGGGPSFFSSLKPNGSFTRAQLEPDDQRVLEELVTAEIVVPTLQKNKVLRVSILGDDNTLTLGGHKNITISKGKGSYDIALIVRTNSTYANLLQKVAYQNITKPQLFVDMAFHHTLSLGPLVFVGETACIACLQGRVSTRWGDEAPPVLPQAVEKYSGVVSEFVASELARIAADDTSLTNKTVSWNFQDRITKQDQLLKVPLCPVCTQNTIDRSGALALPWSKYESTTNPV